MVFIISIDNWLRLVKSLPFINHKCLELRQITKPYQVGLRVSPGGRQQMHLVKSGNILGRFIMFFQKSLIACLLFIASLTTAIASDFNYAWRDKQKALVIDAYEKNPIDWQKMVTDKRIRAFIGKSSDGLQSPWSCSGNATEQKICKKTFQNYFMKQQLYHTRKTLAKALGLKWGAYHLGRPGNPVAQANHFLQFAKPEKDELIALDIEHDDPKKWISFKDAEIFARQIYKRIGRYPVLYTNHNTAQRIAARRDEFPLLSRMQLWYARFKGDIRGAFPMGNWDSYALWQFSAHPNCNKRRCLYRVPGTESNIDVNVSTLTIAEFDKAWPFDGLVPKREPKVEAPEILMVSNEAPAEDTIIKQQINVSETEIAAASALLSSKKATTKVELSEEAEFQITGIDLDEIVVPTARERDVLVTVASIEPSPSKSNQDENYGITTTNYSVEYEVVIPKSDHAEDLTMQLQYLSGAL